jgi:hypothetical protein
MTDEDAILALANLFEAAAGSDWGDFAIGFEVGAAVALGSPEAATQLLALCKRVVHADDPNWRSEVVPAIRKVVELISDREEA